MSSPSPPLSAGMFLMPVHDPKKPLAQCYDEDIELVLNCEEFGLKEFWCGEHHSSVVENIVMPEIFISKDGPLHVRGGVEFNDPDGAKPSTTDHYTLCSCGASKNKPFCDGAHKDSGFKG